MMNWKNPENLLFTFSLEKKRGTRNRHTTRAGMMLIASLFAAWYSTLRFKTSTSFP